MCPSNTSVAPPPPRRPIGERATPVHLWFAFMVCALVLFPRPAGAWTIETVATGGVGAHCDLAIDRSDGLHIAHFAGSQGKLRYAANTGGGWTDAIVDGQTLTGHLPSIAIDSAGRPNIAYFYYSGHRIRYASMANDSWSFSEFEIDDQMEWDIAMALDPEDRPFVSYQNGHFQGEPHDLAMAAYDGATWNVTTVDAPGQVGRGSAIAIDSSGRPWISYYDESAISLKVAHEGDAGWVVETVDADVQFIGFNFRTAIAIDHLDRVHVAYGAYLYDGAAWRGRLRYALGAGGAWTLATVETGAPNRDFRVPSIAVDQAARPRVSYLLYYNVEPITADLHYAWFDGTSWIVEVVDPGDLADSDYSNSIAVDSRGRAHIAYGYGQTTLRHAVGDAPAGAEDPDAGAPVTVSIDAPFPNPVRDLCSVSFTLAAPADVSLTLFDSQGRIARSLTSGWRGAGRHVWTGSVGLPPGVYPCRLAAGPAAATTKLVVVAGR